jgi:hypothetical protein
MFLVSANVRLFWEIVVQKNRPTCADKSAPTVLLIAQHGRNDDQGLINQTVFKVKR